MSNNEWEPYTRKTYRVALLLDVAAKDEREAFGRFNLIVRHLADREEKSLAQIGYTFSEARKPIMGATIFIDQMREVVGPAPAMPLPSMAELIESVTPPMYRSPRPGQLALSDTGSGGDVKPGRASAAE